MLEQKNELQKPELYRKAWKVCCDLRGSLDGIQMRDYIFAMIFYRYISESFVSWFEKPEKDKGNKNFDYVNMSDEEALKWREYSIQVKGFFIAPSCTFEKLWNSLKENVKLRNSLSSELMRIFREIESSSNELEETASIKGLLTNVDWTNEKLGSEVSAINSLIFKMMQEVKSWDFHFDSTQEDNLGNLYEYLMGLYASSSGKKGGEFYTPKGVSQLLARITTFSKEYVKRVYDPTCGSGSLLLKVVALLKEKNIFIKVCGQEKNLTTYNLCRMNMIIHNLSFQKFNIHHGDTLLHPSPEHMKEKFDIIVSNPPYSQKWRDEGFNEERLLDIDERFNRLSKLPPKNQADYAFIFHCVHCLSESGKAAIVCSTSILNRNSEKTFRKWLVDQNYIETLILLPPRLFYGTGISTVILVLSKCKSDNSILFIDASQQFKPSSNSNYLSEDNVEFVFNLYKNRKDDNLLSKLVENKIIQENDYVLSVGKYLEAPEEEKFTQLDIKTLNKEIQDRVEKINTLRSGILDIIADIEQKKDYRT